LDVCDRSAVEGRTTFGYDELNQLTSNSGRGRSYFARRGAAVDSVNGYGNTPLGVAVFNYRGNGDFIMLLRSRGADPWRANKSGNTPIGLARMVANYDVAKIFADLDTE